MHRDQTLSEDNRVMRWGGLAGIAGGLLFILVFAIVGAFVPEHAADPAAAVRWFPDIRTVRIVENGLYLVVLVLWVASFLAVSRAARASLAPALFGGVIGIVGLTLLAAGALPHVAIAPLSDLYHAPAATAGDQATLALLWQATQGLLDASLLAGLALLSVSMVILGLAMAGAPAFGRRIGAFSIGLGAIGVLASIVALVDTRSPAPALGMFALIAFHVVVGRRTYALSRGGWRLEDRATVANGAGARLPAIERVG
jgi:hypothetical protein